jgi:hypothetical protein
MVSISYVDDHDDDDDDDADYRVSIRFGDINMAGRTVDFWCWIFYFTSDIK